MVEDPVHSDFLGYQGSVKTGAGDIAADIRSARLDQVFFNLDPDRFKQFTSLLDAPPGPEIGVMPLEEFKRMTIAIANGEYKAGKNEPKVWVESANVPADALDSLFVLARKKARSVVTNRVLQMFLRSAGVPIFQTAPGMGETGWLECLYPDGSRRIGRLSKDGVFVALGIEDEKSPPVPTNARSRITTLRELAALVLNDEPSARRWMLKGNTTLGGLRPADLGKTKEGFRECLVILGRIETGVFS